MQTFSIPVSTVAPMPVGKPSSNGVTQSAIRENAKQNLRRVGSIPENPHLEKFLSSILDQTKEYPKPVSVISLQYAGSMLPLLTLKSFSLWQGKQKSKKTTALAMAVAAFIKGKSEDPGIQFVANIEGVAMVFDMEQGESYAARTMKLILKLTGLESSPRLIYCDLRGYSPTERMEIIKEGIKHTKGVRLVVIDGLVDLLSDFMDAGEGHLTTTEILKLCSQYDIHIAGVLHQNKNDKNARAHVGTISSQKCEVEISTEIDPQDRNQSQVVCVNSRGIPFEPFAIRWDQGSLPCICQDWTEPTEKKGAAKNYDRSKEIAEAVFKPLSALSHSEAVKAIMNAGNKSESTAKRMLKDFMGWDFVAKGPDGNYRLNTPDSSGVQAGSNRVHEPVQV